MNRRCVIGWIAKTAGLAATFPLFAWLGGKPAAAAALKPTPSQTEGPYYPLMKPADADWNLLRWHDRIQGEKLELSGRVLGIDGEPLSGASVEIWQADGQGIYDHPYDSRRTQLDPAFRGFGEVRTNERGEYRFLTMVPGPYTGRPPHIHVKVRAEGRDILTTQLYIKDHPENDRDGIFSRLFHGDRSRLMMTFTKGKGVAADKRARFDFVL
jgi:protocatechuate 3,4-dioxygenase beta subunit